jgi:hypothetical protein
VSEDRFPSGPWVGFYNYVPGDRHRMDLRLTFANGRMSGDGNDDVGRFLISGQYDAASRECHWTKTYLGSHDVFYRGFREGKGIRGTWEIGVLNHGGFHIWPKGAAEGEGESACAAATVPLEAVGEWKENQPEQKPQFQPQSRSGAEHPSTRLQHPRRRSSTSSSHWPSSSCG